MNNYKRLNLSRQKSICQCVHFSHSCSEIAETTFTVRVETNKVERDQSTCSTQPPSSSQEDTETPLALVDSKTLQEESPKEKSSVKESPIEESPVEESPIEELTKCRIDKQEDSEGLCYSDRSDCCTPTEDLQYYTDCQALFNASSATGDEIFYSQLEDLTLSTMSVSEDFPSDATEPNQSTFCCDIFTQGIKEETKSVLEDDLEEDPTNVKHQEPQEIIDPTTQVQVKSSYSDCFPI